MIPVDRPLTLRVATDSVEDHVAAHRIALDLFGAAPLSEFLPARDHPQYLETLCELVRAEMTHLWSLGNRVRLENYQATFPELFRQRSFALKLAQEEIRLRREAGDESAASESQESEFDLYPPTQGPVSKVVSSWPSIEVGRTHPNRPVKGGPIPSDPEIVWKLNQVMTEMPKVGDDFLGFSLLAELGKGAFGKVFLAQQADLAGRFVALKVAAGLFNESQTLAQLQHTHIVPIYSYHHGQPFQAVCMPYLGATTLAHILADIRTHNAMPSSGKELVSTLNFRKKSTRRLEELSRECTPEALGISPPDEPAAAPQPMPVATLELEGMSYVDSILWLAVRLADGLAHAHERGIIHRDLKPANVLLTDDGVPMLLDFNLAQNTRAHESAAAAAIGGTLPYMAPEHLEAFRGSEQAVDARSDVYSLGVILFELLTGAAPFATYRKLPARDVIARMISDRQPGAPGLRPLNASIAPAVEAIVLKCLCADPARRYQNARELQEDLQRQLESRPLKHAPNPSLWERGQKFRRRHPKLTSATSVACIAALLLAGLGSIFVYREEQHAVRREQHARLEAKATLSRFQDDAKNSYFLLTARSAKRQIDEGAQACKAALQHFQILDNPAWRESAAVERLSDKDRQTLEREAGQLLILLAQAQQMAGDQELDPEKRAAFFQEGLHLCSLASGCFPAEQTPRALWQQQGDLHQRLNARAEAQKHFDRAKKAEFATANDRYLTARQLAEEGKFLAALPLVREAVAMKPHDFNFNFLQGICHDHLGQYKEAIGCYRSCIALRPDFFAPWYNRGLSQLRLNQWEAALGDLNQAEKLRPEFTEIYLHRAVALQGLKKHDDAIKDLSVALERKFAETRAYLLRAKLREKVNDMDGAKKDLTEGLRHDPTDDLGWIARGLAHLPEEPKKALADFDEALKLNPRSFAALQNKAHVLGKYFRRLDDAIKVLDKAVELYPDNPLPRAGRGVYLGRQGKRDAALADAKAALTLDSSPSNLYQVAGIYALTSKQEPEDQREAIALLKQALRNGFGYEHMNVDRDLDPIRESPVFRQLLDGARVLGSAGTTRGRN